MSQSWESDLYTASTVANTTLNNMELMFATLRSSFSGASAPGSVVAGQVWYDTAKTLLKHRNNANSAWRGILAGTTALKLWLYRNAAEEGWAIDATVTDNVLALKGGSAAYSISGGTKDKGAWAISGITTNTTGNHDHALPFWFVWGGPEVRWSDNMFGTRTISSTLMKLDQGPEAAGDENRTTVSESSTDGDHSHTGSSDAGWRPLAAVGTLQYPDV